MSPTIYIPDLQGVPLLKALLWQHNNAHKLVALIRAKNNWHAYHNERFWINWARDVFDLRTANAFGLQVWAIILGVPITIGTPDPVTIRPAWGFGTHNRNFGNGNFLPHASYIEKLSIEEARLLLRIRYFALICRPNVWQINEFFQRVYPDISCLDSTNMSAITYIFRRPLSAALMGMLVRHNVLPRPGAVGMNIEVFGRKVFGYGEYNENFENGTFASIF